MLIHWIWYAQCSGISLRQKLALLEQFRDPEELYYTGADTLSGCEGVDQGILEALQNKNLTPAEHILEECARQRIHLLTYRDAGYPAKLKNIDGPPLVLYYKGRLPEFDRNPMIGVVGTRKASVYGMTVAKRMGYQIAQCGGILVSGLASGIDGAAMGGALTAGQPVVGILGCGLDVVYPPSNRGLYSDTARQGCLMSEYPPGTPPYRGNFPQRNRIISGICDGVLVVEAPQISGALITAKKAAEQGRDVFAVPGNVDTPTCAGSNALLRDGAMLVATGWDVVGEYAHLYPDKVRRDTGPVQVLGYEDETIKIDEIRPKVAQKPKIPRAKAKSDRQPEKKPIDKAPPPPYSDHSGSLASLTGDELAIAKLLTREPQLLDDVIDRAELPGGAVQAALTLLEIKGIIRRLPGNRLCLKS